MAEHRQSTIVGIFALAGLGVLCTLVFMFGGGRLLFASTYDINVRFPAGLVGVQEGQGVTLYGKRIGETKAIEFWDPHRLQDGIKVVVTVEDQYQVPTASEVIVATSIMGIGRPSIQIQVVDPDDTSYLPRDGSRAIPGRMVNPLDQVVPPDMQRTLEEAARGLGKLTDALTPAADSLNRLLEERDVRDVDLEKATANLRTIVQRFDEALKNLNAIIGDQENQRNFHEVLANANLMSQRGIEAMDGLKELSAEGKQATKEVGRLVQRLAVAADDLSVVLKQVNDVVMLMNQGEGTMGLLLRDNRLYEEMVLSAKRLTKALDDLREVLKDGHLRLKL